jgi:NADH-quinone oxidoreductase subunit L
MPPSRDPNRSRSSVSVGAFTAIFAATIALTQTDIKGALAYSTISQLGYMFAGLAVAETTRWYLHLFTHASSRAAFLGAGSVIHALHENGIGAQNCEHGRLARWLPITAFGRC